MTRKVFIATTGAGSGAQDWIWQTPGVSKWFAGATFPYREDLLEQYIGYRPEKFVHPDVAVELAMRAYQDAWQAPGDDAIGIGCSAAVATDRLRKGDYVAYIAICDTKHGVRLLKKQFEPQIGAEHRHNQGAEVDRIVADIAIFGNLVYGSNPIDVTSTAKWLLLNRPYVAYNGSKYSEDKLRNEVIQPVTDSKDKLCRPIYAGAFNPPHAGHFAIADKTNSIFNIEMVSPHKGELHVTEVLQRLKLLRGYDTLVTSGCSLYLDKSNRFNHHPLVMGADAFLRMLDPKWGPEPKKLMEDFSQNRTPLMIFGREINGKYVSADEAISLVPEACVCYDLIPIEGRWDISSSEIRNKNKE